MVNQEIKFNVIISQDARIDESTFQGVNVKLAYYTACYQDNSRERQLGGVNHTMTYMISPHELGTNMGVHDLLIRTGNPATSIKPEISAILEYYEHIGATLTDTKKQIYGEHDGFYDLFRTEPVPRELEEQIDQLLGLTESYERDVRLHTAMGSRRHPLAEILVELLKPKQQ